MNIYTKTELKRMNENVIFKSGFIIERNKNSLREECNYIFTCSIEKNIKEILKEFDKYDFILQGKIKLNSVSMS